MDTELAEMKECLARVDERTAAILQHQEDQKSALEAHEERDREDFKEVRTEISAVRVKQNWILGVGSTLVFAGTIVAGLFKGMFGG